MATGQKWKPDTLPPLRQDSGRFLVEQVEAHLLKAVCKRFPDAIETGAARTMAVGYGLAFSALYAGCRPWD